ncbi:MAG TPA: chorismate synthase [Thermoanaerobaculia bacterium]|nr:chorismate synthase [Thermoanaerobaculia bacterium]
MPRIELITAGESHGEGLTAILSGVPAGLKIDPAFVTSELKRRQHGHGRGRRMQIEQDEAVLTGGVRGGETIGSPIALWIRNRDHASWKGIMGAEGLDAEKVARRRLRSPRPGHADLAGGLKYLRRDLRDILERASARESAARVAAGAIAKLLLAELGVSIRSALVALGPLGAIPAELAWEDLEQVDEESPLRALDRGLEPEMVALVDEMKGRGDTLGGSVVVAAHGLPTGLGSHVQWNERLDGRLAQALMSVPTVKGVMIGDAVSISRAPGSEAHDAIERGDAGAWRRASNRAGGIEGGMTNGEDLVLYTFEKPISTLRQGLPSIDLDTMEPHSAQYERSDVTAVPACGVIAEAMVALILADAMADKLGGDSLAEMKAHLEGTKTLQREWPGQPNGAR